MIFDYNPITGLNYYTYENEIIFELSEIPCDLTRPTAELIKEWCDTVRKLGISIRDSTKSTIEIFMPIYSNVE